MRARMVLALFLAVLLPEAGFQRCGLGRPAFAELGGGDAEIAAGGILDPVNARAELGDVQIELEDPSLGKVFFELAGEDRFFDFAQWIS